MGQDQSSGQQQQTPGVTGKPMDRVDGPLKVTGGAKYAAEFSVPGTVYGCLVQSTIAKGTVKSVDSREAEHVPGVLAVITYSNMPKIIEPTGPPSGVSHPLLDSNINYSGQNIALVIAQTFEQAEHAADLVKVEYDAAKPIVDMEKNMDQAFIYQRGRLKVAKRGDFDSAIASAPKKLDTVYRTPVEHHNPMEPHATIAIWNNGELLAYDATQGVTNVAHNLAQIFGLTKAQVRVVDPFVGGGFGCKGQSWPNAPLAALAAQVVGKPVKIAISRKQMFTSNGHRPPTRQAVTAGIGTDGKLVALKADIVNATSQTEEFEEPSGTQFNVNYSCPNVYVRQQLIRVDQPPPTYMRAPGESSGSFGMETAMDELAYELGIDPVDLRLRNYAETDEGAKKPWSSKHLKECYQQAAASFGWEKRNPVVGSMKNGRMLVGYGMATATYPANFRSCQARASLFADGTVLIQCGTQDLGTGTYTILTQIAADAVGVKPEKVRVEIADTRLPEAPGSGGSTSAASAGSAVMEAGQALKSAMIGFVTGYVKTPFYNSANSDIEAKDGVLYSRNAPTKKMSYTDIMNFIGKKVVQAGATAQPGIERGPGAQGHSFQGFGAQFCEVHVDPDLRMMRVARWTGAFALGKVLNRKTITSQLHGGIVWGIGMGLLEETVADPTFGRYVNSNLAEYHVPVNRDVPPIDIILVEEEDKLVSPVGAKGAGEIGITGAAAAIGNAVFHATGKRVRDLPITLDKIL
jgi:xanthine dehydrogenase YagR molybdenum-binding subunit